MMVTMIFEISFHSKPFHCNISTAKAIIATSKIPVSSLHPKNEMTSLIRSVVFVRLLSNTNTLFVTNANTTAASHARMVLTMLRSVNALQQPVANCINCSSAYSKKQVQQQLFIFSQCFNYFYHTLFP